MTSQDTQIEELDRTPAAPAKPREHRLPKWRVGSHPVHPVAPFPMCMTPEALSELLRTVGSLPPESGAKGFGPMDRMGIDRIEFDVLGSTRAGGALYSPDVEWGSKLCAGYLSFPEPSTRVWTGDIHSHPGGYGSFSQKAGKALGDLGYVEEVFEQNEAMQWFFCPILTHTGTGEVVIHPWVCRRDMVLMIAEFRVCETSEFPPRQFNPEWERSLTQAAGIPQEAEPPVAGREPQEVAPARASVAGVATKDTPVAVDRRLVLYRKRLAGVVSDTFCGKTILTVGTGAGSYMVEKLARLCPRRVKNCDFDIVELPNLARTAYAFDDAIMGRLKVNALARRLRDVNPLVEVASYPRAVTDMTADELDDLFEGVDLVVAGTDQFEAQALINAEAMRRGIPAVFIGIHEGAKGGRVIWTVPGETPCYRCVARDRYLAAERGEDGHVNLDGATGALMDCQFIDMVALKVAVAILERGKDSAIGEFFRRMAGRNDIIIRCDPGYEWGGRMWDALLGDLPKEPKDFAQELKEAALFAMDSIWIRGEYDPDCPDCGGKASGAAR